MRTLYAVLVVAAIVVSAGFTYFARASDAGADGDSHFAPVTVNPVDGTVTLRIQDFLHIINMNNANAAEADRLRAKSGCT